MRWVDTRARTGARSSGEPKAHERLRREVAIVRLVVELGGEQHAVELLANAWMGHVKGQRRGARVKVRRELLPDGPPVGPFVIRVVRPVEDGGAVLDDAEPELAWTVVDLEVADPDRKRAGLRDDDSVRGLPGEVRRTEDGVAGGRRVDVVRPPLPRGPLGARGGEVFPFDEDGPAAMVRACACGGDDSGGGEKEACDQDGCESLGHSESRDVLGRRANAVGRRVARPARTRQHASRSLRQ